MKKLNLKVLLLITLLSGICFKASATAMKENSLVKYNPNNAITGNKEVTEYKKNNGVITEIKKESKKDKGKIYNLVIKDTSGSTSTCKERIYFDYILKILETEFSDRYKMELGNIFKNINISKNNGNIYINFELSVPTEEEVISDKIIEFASSIFIPKDLNKTKNNLNEIINKYNLKDMKIEKEKIINEEIDKLNKYEAEIKTKYDNRRSFFNSPMQGFFGINNMFSNIEKMFDNSFFANDLFTSDPFKDSELNDIKKEVKQEREEQEKNDIINKIEEKKSGLMKLKNKETDLKDLTALINNIESLNSDGQYIKISKSISSVSTN